MYKSKKVLAILAVLVFSSVSIFAQSSADAPVYISVKKSLSILPVAGGSLDFGTLLYGSADAATKTPELGAKFVVDGSEIRDISVSYSATTLTNQFLDNLTFTPEVEQTGKNSTYTGAASLVSGAPVSTGDDGKLYIWVGGSIDFGATTEEGEYQGLFSMSVAYN